MKCRTHQKDLCPECIEIAPPPGGFTPEMKSELAKMLGDASAEQIKSLEEKIAKVEKDNKELTDTIARAQAMRLAGGDNGVAGGDMGGKSIVRYERRAHPGGAIKLIPKFESVSSEAKEMTEGIAKSVREVAEGIRRSVSSGVPMNFTPNGPVSKTVTPISFGDSSGGALAMGEISDVIETLAYSESVLLPMVRVESLTKRDRMFRQQILDLTATGTLPENIYGITFLPRLPGAAMASTGAPTFKWRQMTAKEEYAFQAVDMELIEDVPEWLSLMTSQVGESWARHIDRNSFDGPLTGLQPAVPVGFLNDSEHVPSIALRKTSGKVNWEDFINCKKKLSPVFQKGRAVFFCRPETWLDYQLNTVGASNNIFVPSASLGQPFVAQVAGSPVVETIDARALGEKADLICMDPAAIVIGLRKGIEFATSAEFYFDKNQLAMRWLFAWDRLTLYKEGISVLKKETS